VSSKDLPTVEAGSARPGAVSKSARPDDEIATAGQMQVLHEGTAALLLPQIIANAMLKQIIKVAVLNDTTTSACSPNLSKSRSIQGLRGDLDFVHSQSAARAGPPHYSVAGGKCVSSNRVQGNKRTDTTINLSLQPGERNDPKTKHPMDCGGRTATDRDEGSRPVNHINRCGSA